MNKINWKEIKETIADGNDEARREAKKSGSVVRSRGAKLVVVDGSNETLVSSADCWDFPSSKKMFIGDLEHIKKMYPTATEIHIDIAWDASDSVRYFLECDGYVSFAGDVSRLVYTF